MHAHVHANTQVMKDKLEHARLKAEVAEEEEARGKAADTDAVRRALATQVCVCARARCTQRVNRLVSLCLSCLAGYPCTC